MPIKKINKADRIIMISALIFFFLFDRDPEYRLYRYILHNKNPILKTKKNLKSSRRAVNNPNK